MLKAKTLLAALTVIGSLSVHAASTLIADFSADFVRSGNGDGSAYVGTEVPTTGWSYLHSTNGSGVAADYLPMVASTNLTPETWASTITGTTPYVGIGTWNSAAGDNRAIAAYTIQPGEEGSISVVNSSVYVPNASSDGIGIEVYVNDTIAIPRKVVKPQMLENFSGSLGTLAVGDVVYVVMDKKFTAVKDDTIIDYQLVTGDPLLLQADMSSTNVFVYEPTTLSWKVATNVTSITVSPAIQGSTNLVPFTTAGIGSITAYPTNDTTYTFTVTRGETETEVRTFTVTTMPMKINSFTSSPTLLYSGDSVALNWNVNGAQTISIDEGATPLFTTNSLTGSFHVTPTLGAHTYTLSAINGSGTLTTNLTITVNPMTIISFTATPDPVYANDTLVLNWNAPGATGITIKEGITDITTSTNANSSYGIYHPTAGSHTYTLIATNTVDSLQTNLTVVVEAPVGTYIVDSSYEKGNGSFEYDAAGNPLVSGTQPGKWVNNASGSALSLNGGALTLTATAAVVADNTQAANGATGTMALKLSGKLGTSGAILNTGYAVGASDQLSLTFDWMISNNAVGGSKVNVYLFTSDTDALAGTLTTLAYQQFSANSKATFSESAIASIVVNPANIGKQLWLAFQKDSSSVNSENLYVDNVKLVKAFQETPVPSTVTLTSGNGVVTLGTTQMVASATYILQGTESLVPTNWVDLATTSGVTVADWIVPTTNSVQFFRVITP